MISFEIPPPLYSAAERTEVAANDHLHATTESNYSLASDQAHALDEK
jgi:hypothetical protein